MKSIPITKIGFEKLCKELNYLKNVKRPEIISSISEAREYGDLKENSEYHAAKEEQEFCENRILEIEEKLSKIQIIDVTQLTPSKRIVFGTTVVIENLYSKKKKTYRIVGDDEADCKQDTISINSPLSRGLIGKEKGETVVIDTPSGKIKYKILDVIYL